MVKLFSQNVQSNENETDEGSEIPSGGRVVQESTSRDSDLLYTTMQFNSKDVSKKIKNDGEIRPTKILGRKPQIISGESAPATFETLFNEFNLQAYPYYNFWTPDELTNDKDEKGKRNFEDIPRYIKLVWNPAPNLPDPEEKATAKPVERRGIDPVILSRDLDKPLSFFDRGIIFTPDHLQTLGFSSLKGLFGNGYLSAGALETIVDLPLKNAGLDDQKKNSLTGLIDEDAFLTDETYSGISIHELQAQVNQISNPVAAMSDSEVRSISDSVDSKKAELVDGKMLISKPTEAGGKLTISSVHPSSPTIGYSANTSLNSRDTISDPVMELSDALTRTESSPIENDTVQTKVKFTDVALGGLVNQKRINMMNSPEHVENLSSIAPVLSQLEIFSRISSTRQRKLAEPPSLPSPKIKPLEYVGYIIEKFRKNPNGVFEKVSEIDIPNIKIDSFIDTKIVYGSVYRYRMKSVLRWTRPANIGVEGDDSSILTTFASQTYPLANYKSSYFTSEWGKRWSYAACIDTMPPPPPDELVVRPESHRKRIVITFRKPEDIQLDVSGFKLLRKVKDNGGRDISDWHVIKDFDSPMNVLYFDYDIVENRKYVYSAQTISRHNEESFLSEQLCTRINPKYHTKGEYPVEFVSCAGVRRQYTGAFSTIPNGITKTELLVAVQPARSGKKQDKKTVIVSGRNVNGSISLTNSSYIARIESLDTGEIRDLHFESTVVNQPDVQIVETSDVFAANYVISSNEQQSNLVSPGVGNRSSNISRSRDEQVLTQDLPLPGETYDTKG